jgi:Fe-S cluster assembly ATPase SufC
MSLLEIGSVTKRFGGFTAVDKVSLKVNKGDIKFLIGPNGAGKSTLFKMIIGVHSLNSGNVLFNGKKIENFIDVFPTLDDKDFDFSYELSERTPNPEAKVQNIENVKEWIKSLYKNILDMDISENDEGLQHWVSKIEQNIPKEQIENYFRETAKQELQKNSKIELKDLFDQDDNLKKVLLIQPESIGDIFLVTSLFESLRSRYSSDQYKIYIATKPEYREIIEGNPYIDKWIPYHQIMDSAIIMEGGMGQNGLCDIVYHPYFSTQRLLSYMHNGEDKIDLELK